MAMTQKSGLQQHGGVKASNTLSIYHQEPRLNLMPHRELADWEHEVGGSTHNRQNTSSFSSSYTQNDLKLSLIPFMNCPHLPWIKHKESDAGKGGEGEGSEGRT